MPIHALQSRSCAPASSSAPHAAGAACSSGGEVAPLTLTQEQRTFVTETTRRAALKQRFCGVLHKATKEAQRLASAARLGPPASGSFRELKHAHDAFTLRSHGRPFDEAAARGVLRLAQTYIRKASETASAKASAKAENSAKPKVRAAKLVLAKAIKDDLDRAVQQDRACRQLGIDAQPHRFHPELQKRSAGRQSHAAGLCSAFQDVNRPLDGTSARTVRDADGHAVYRCLPLPTRRASGPDREGPQHAVLASVLHRELLDEVGIDLRLPVATLAMLDGVPGVLIDAVDLPRVPEGRAMPAQEAQLALLAQWLVGPSRGDWSDFRVDDEGRIRMSPCAMPERTREPRLRAVEALSGVSPLAIDRSDPADPTPLAVLHRPWTQDLETRLAKVSLAPLRTSLVNAHSRINLDAARLCKIGGREGGIQDSPMLPVHTAEKLLARLQALQTVLLEAIAERDEFVRQHPGCTPPALPPVPMLLADAAEQLEAWTPPSPPASLPPSSPPLATASPPASPARQATDATATAEPLPVKDELPRDRRERVRRSTPATTLTQRLLFRHPLRQHRLESEASLQGLQIRRPAARPAALRMVDRCCAGVARLLGVKDPLHEHRIAHAREYYAAGTLKKAP